MTCVLVMVFKVDPCEVVFDIVNRNEVFSKDLYYAGLTTDIQVPWGTLGTVVVRAPQLEVNGVANDRAFVKLLTLTSTIISWMSSLGTFDVIPFGSPLLEHHKGKSNGFDQFGIRMEQSPREQTHNFVTFIHCLQQAIIETNITI